MSTIFKIRRASVLGDDEIRRLCLPNPEVSLDKIRERAKLLFSLPDNQLWLFKYQDQEGDLVTLTEGYEMIDLLDWAWSHGEGQSRTVRLELVLQPASRLRVQSALFGRFFERSPVEATKEKAQREPVVLGRCDVSGALLQPGQGWWHQPNTIYDLSTAEWEKLDKKHRAEFVPVSGAQDLGREACRYQTAGFNRSVEFSAPTNEDHLQTSQHQQQSGDREQPSDDGFESPTQRFRVEVLSGPSLAAGTAVAPGSRVTASWELRNNTDTAWDGIRLRPCSPNPLQVEDEGVEVPRLCAGGSGTVFVQVAAPVRLAGQRVVAEFELVDSFGVVLSDKVSLDVAVKNEKENQTESAPIPDEDELVIVLQDMGFEYEADARMAIRRTQGDVNAAMHLLLSPACSR